jgi:hypothetical protein
MASQHLSEGAATEVTKNLVRRKTLSTTDEVTNTADEIMFRVVATTVVLRLGGLRQNTAALC